MINVPIPDIRKHWEDTLHVSLAHVPEVEWRHFLAVDGPFTAADWQQMPVLFRALTGRRD